MNIELRAFFEYFSNDAACTKQAFSKQRRKLKPDFFHHWNKKLTESFYRQCQNQCSYWNGFKLLATDGSSVILPDTQEIRNAYGYTVNQTNQGSPVARICALYDVLNGLVIKSLLHPYTVSEENVVLSILEQEELQESLLLFDRGYLSYWLIHQLLEKNTRFVIRAASIPAMMYLNTKKTSCKQVYFP